MSSGGGHGLEGDAFPCVCIGMHSHFAMTLGAVSRALLNPPGVKDRPGRVEGCVHGVIRPRPRIVSRASEVAWPAVAEFLRFGIPPKCRSQPFSLIFVDQVKCDQYGEIPTGRAVVTLSMIEADPEEVLDRDVLHARSGGLALANRRAAQR